MKKKVRSRDSVQDLKEALRTNIVYSSEYDYDTEYSCEDSGCDGDICRCGTIINFQLTYTNPRPIINRLEELYTKGIESYCVDRIIQHGPAGKADSYERSNTNGYYGEEIGNILLEEGPITQIIDTLTQFATMPSDVEKVKFALSREYGFLLPEIKNLKKVSIEIVPLDKLGRIMRKLDAKALEQYSEELRTYDYRKHTEEYRVPDPVTPRGFALKEQSGWRLIDGYHRVAVVEQKTKEKAVMLVVGE